MFHRSFFNKVEEQNDSLTLSTPLLHSDPNSVSVTEEHEEQKQGAESESREGPEVRNLSLHEKVKSARQVLKTTKYTNGRLIAQYLSKYEWYNPSIEKNRTHPLQKYATSNHHGFHCGGDAEIDVVTREKPDIAKAWHYFEYVTLPRYIDTNPGENNPSLWENCKYAIKLYFNSVDDDKQLTNAAAGESRFHTRLYSPLTTPTSQIGDFGLGIGIFLATTRKVSLMLFIAGLLSLPNLYYYASEEYSDRQPGVNILAKGSAICTRQKLVPCPTCTQTNFTRNRMDDRLVLGTLVNEDNTQTPKTTLYFAVKNDCEGAKLAEGIVSLVVTLFIFIYMINLRRNQRVVEKSLDEDEQTARDYSVVISNPPSDADDPLEWESFFAKFGVECATCTIAISNDFLLEILRERKEIIYKLESILAPGTPKDDLNLARIAADIEAKWTYQEHVKSLFFRIFGVYNDVPSLYAKLIVLKAKIKGLAQLDYPVTRVFISFQTESMKHKILEEFSIGQVNFIFNNTPESYPKQEILFRSKFLLDVQQAEEPSTVRWTNLNTPLLKFIKGLLISMTYTILMLAAAVVVAYYVSDHYPFYIPYLISIFNLFAKSFTRFITTFESHSFESSKQITTFVKGTLFTFSSTFLIIKYITPFATTITVGRSHLIYTLYKTLIFDAIATVSLQLFDPIGNFSRHYLALRAPDQESMNAKFRGMYYDMADRYVNMWKALFLVLCYGSIFPMLYFLSSAIFFFFSFVDRFSIMRTWYRAPKFGPHIAECSRLHITSLALILMVVTTSAAWAGFPYDDLCEAKDTDTIIAGTYAVDPNLIAVRGTTNSSRLEIFSNATQYKFCIQDFERLSKFPYIPSFQPDGFHWMSNQQEIVCAIWGWISVVSIIFFSLRYCLVVFPIIWRFWFGGYKPVTVDQGISYSEMISKHHLQHEKDDASVSRKIFVHDAYIPLVDSDYFSFPLLACYDANGEIAYGNLQDYLSNQATVGGFNLVHDASNVLNMPDLEPRKDINVFSEFYFFGDSSDITNSVRTERLYWLRNSLAES